MKKTALFCYLLLWSLHLYSQPKLVTTLSFSPGHFVGTDNLLFYTNFDADTLWRSNGTSSGTYVVATDLNNPNYFTKVNNRLYFIENGNRLWTSDGSPSGTKLLASFFSIASLTAFNNTLLFIGGTTSGKELWKSDGTVGGTVQIKDIYPGSSGGLDGTSGELTQVDSIVYFTANDGIYGKELWRTNGTVSGTYMVKDLLAGSSGANPSQLDKFGNKLLFNTYNILWKTDGSGPGTEVIDTLIAARSKGMEINGDFVFMMSPIEPQELELWATDGSYGGTYKAYVFSNMSVHQFFNLNNTLYVQVGHGEYSFLYRFNTGVGFQVVGSWINYSYYYQSSLLLGDAIYFRPTIDTGDDLYWDTYQIGNGSSAVLLRSQYPALNNSAIKAIASFAGVGTNLFFSSYDPYSTTGQYRIWKLIPGSTQQAYGLTSFTLLNADTDADISTLTNGTNVDADAAVSVRANGQSGVESVKFYVNGSLVRIENELPFTIAGQTAGDYAEWLKPYGNVKIAAVPYPADNGLGSPGDTLKVTIFVSDSDTSDITFTLVNALTDLDIGSLTNGQIINLASIGTNKLNIRANSVMPNTSSIVFDFNGVNSFRIENSEPYSMFTDLNGDYNPWTAVVGTHIVKATPYTGNNAAGTAGRPAIIQFTIVNGGAKYQSMEIYPNPVEESLSFQIASEEASEAVIVITDLNGKEYYSGRTTISDGKITDLTALGMSAGIYIVKVTTGNNVYVTHIVKK